MKSAVVATLTRRRCSLRPPKMGIQCGRSPLLAACRKPLSVHVWHFICVLSCGSRPSESDEMKYVLVSNGSMFICRPASAGQHQRVSELATRSRRLRNDGLSTNWLDMVARDCEQSVLSTPVLSNPPDFGPRVSWHSRSSSSISSTISLRTICLLVRFGACYMSWSGDHDSQTALGRSNFCLDV